MDVDPRTIVGRSVPPPAEPVVVLKFNYRFKNVNAGETAGFPRSEAQQLLKMECPGSSGKMVAELVEETKKSK